MLNLATVAYTQYVASYNTPGYKILACVLTFLVFIVYTLYELKYRRYNWIVRHEHHSNRFFQATERARHQALWEDLKSIF